MKIEIDIDVESIVREALKKKQSEQIASAPVEAPPVNGKSKWEYGRVSGKRRTTEELALHEAEKKLKRRLTPEEKGEIKAKVHIDETTENKIKEAVIKKDRIEKIAAEGMAAATKELKEEKEITLESDIKMVEETIPETEDFNLPKSLFQ